MNMESRSAFIVIVGRPNTGKSSLLNKLVGEKIAIISDKPQTTRTRITGILTKDNIQYVFTDTPGMHKPKTKLSEHMVSAVRESYSGVDLALLVVDVTKKISASDTELANSLSQSGVPIVLLINKIDLLADKSKLMAIIDSYSQLADFAAVIPLSVIKSDGIDLVWDEINAHTIVGPHYFPDDALTDQPEKVVAAELLREQMLRLLNQEVPHGIAITIEKMREREDKPIMDIDAVIYCERSSHKGIVIGKNGAMLKLIASNARNEMEMFFNVKINLQCWVKVKEDWRNKEGMIKNFGLS